MNLLSLLRDFDVGLYGYFEKEIEGQHSSLSFIPDENSTSPLCASIMGNVLVNSVSKASVIRADSLEAMTTRRICLLFRAQHANVRTITIEAASRVVFQALTRRGDVVMSLDLRKKEHCNSENLAYRFVNFSIDPVTQRLDLEAIERQAMQCRPQLIIVSPVNYPLELDYARFADIAHACGAILWCDISQISGLIAGDVLRSPVPYADIVTFTAHGSMQGPQSSVILTTADLANAVDRVVTTSGHHGLLTAQLAALSARMLEMQDPAYKQYTKAVLENARALADGLASGGLKLISGGTDSHLVIADTKNCAISARGAQELLADVGVMVRICALQTSDPKVRFEAVRFSSLSPTTRGVEAGQLRAVGLAIAGYLLHVDEEHATRLKTLVTEITAQLPSFAECWLPEGMRAALAEYNKIFA